MQMVPRLEKWLVQGHPQVGLTRDEVSCLPLLSPVSHTAVTTVLRQSEVNATSEESLTLVGRNPAAGCPLGHICHRVKTKVGPELVNLLRLQAMHTRMQCFVRTRCFYRSWHWVALTRHRAMWARMLLSAHACV